MSTPLTFNQIIDVALIARGHTDANKRATRATMSRAAYFGTDTSPRGAKRQKGYFSEELVNNVLNRYLPSVEWFLHVPKPGGIEALGKVRHSAGIGAAFIRAHKKMGGDIGLKLRLEQLAQYVFDKQGAAYKFPEANAFIMEITLGEIDWDGRNRIKIGTLCALTQDVIESCLTEKEYV